MMRPQKISQQQIIQISALLFKQYGYSATSMEMLAKACGLTKAAFYYYYPNKQALLLAVVTTVRMQAVDKLFALVYQDQPVEIAYLHLHQMAEKFFTQSICGCLMAMVALDIRQECPEVWLQIRAFFNDWQQTMQHLFVQVHSQKQAEIYAKQSIADYEGAILMTRITQDDFYLSQVKQRILALLQHKA